MQSIIELRRGAAAGRVVFLEDYDIDLARMIIPGCDIWLNTPRRPYEASGTSGMKAAVNGVLNLSVLDGWWAEAYDPAYGWAIDGGSDEEDAEQLYTLLEQQVVPRYHARDAWLESMKSSIAELAPRFSMQRTVIEYADRYYVPARARVGLLDGLGPGGLLAQALDQLLHVLQLLFEVLAVGLQPVGPLLPARVAAEAAPAMMMSSTHMRSPPFASSTIIVITW